MNIILAVEAKFYQIDIDLAYFQSTSESLRSNRYTALNQQFNN